MKKIKNLDCRPPHQTEKELNHALGYWLQLRETEGIDNLNKY